MLLEGKTVLVSGVGPGVGLELARAAAREGARVVLAARREAFLEEVAQELNRAGTRTLCVPTDITEPEQCAKLARLAAREFGRIDVLINNAFAMGRRIAFEEADIAKFRTPLKVNFFGSLQVSQSVIPQMKSQGGGSIVMIGTMASRKPLPGDTGYAASKAALLAAARNMALELGPYGIRVNTVVMGWMWGPTAEGHVETLAEQRGVSTDAILDEVRGRTALRIVPDDADCANAAIFLASDRARAITGATLDVNAGEWMP